MAKMKIPLRDGSEMEVPPTWIRDWCELYFADDVYVALHKCRIWNLERPNQRKTARGLRKHIGHFMKDCRLKPQMRMIKREVEERPQIDKEVIGQNVNRMKELLRR